MPSMTQSGRRCSWLGTMQMITKARIHDVKEHIAGRKEIRSAEEFLAELRGQETIAEETIVKLLQEVEE